MNNLTIRKSRDSHFFDYWEVIGFSDEELAELRAARDEKGYFALKETLVDLVDRHNPNQGTCWANGYGIYGVWFGENENADVIYVETGNSCD